jgi:hypothetical protein
MMMSCRGKRGNSSCLKKRSVIESVFSLQKMFRDDKSRLRLHQRQSSKQKRGGTMPIVDCSIVPPPKLFALTRVLPPSEQISSRFTGRLRFMAKSKPMALYYPCAGTSLERRPHLFGRALQNQLERAQQHVLPKGVLDFLLGHKRYIPEEWKKEEAIFFWGTIFGGSMHRLVHCLYWDGRDWLSHDHSFIQNWNNPGYCAAIAA